MAIDWNSFAQSSFDFLYSLYVKLFIGYIILYFAITIIFPPPKAKPANTQPNQQQDAANNTQQTSTTPVAAAAATVPPSQSGKRSWRRMVYYFVQFILYFSTIRLLLRWHIDEHPISEILFDTAPKADDIVMRYIGKDKEIKNLDGKVVLVTGANVGIGLETARSLVHAGATVVIGSRSYDKGLKAANDINSKNKKLASPNGKAVLLQSHPTLDLASLKSVREFSHAFKKEYNRLDLLIQNAGVNTALYDVTEQGLPITFGVNHVGHFLLTKHLLPLIKNAADQSPSQAPRIVVLSSYAPQVFAKSTTSLTFDELVSRDSSPIAFMTNPMRGFQEYGHSKLVNTMFVRELAKRYPFARSYSVHPGIIHTELGVLRTDPSKPLLERSLAQFTAIGQSVFYLMVPFTKSLEQGAATTLYAALAPELANTSGKHYSDCHESALFPITLNETLTNELWDYSEKLVASFSD